MGLARDGWLELSDSEMGLKICAICGRLLWYAPTSRARPSEESTADFSRSSALI